MSTNLTLSKRKEGQNPRQARAEGNIPVTIYGKNLQESVSLQILKNDFRKLHLSRCFQTINGSVDGSDK